MAEKRYLAFTTAELLCVLLIIAAISLSSLALVTRSDEMIITEEAESLREWLSEAILTAAHDRTSFKIYVTEPQRHRTELVLIPYEGSSKLKTDTWRSEKTWVQGGIPKELAFSGEWHTMTPAVTFAVRPPEGISKILYVKISGAGYVSMTNKK